MTARLPDHLIEVPELVTTAAAPKADNDITVLPVSENTALPVGHPDRLDAAAIRRHSWRRRCNVRTTVFRHRFGSAEMRP